MSIETNDGGLLKAIGTVIIPALGADPCVFAGAGIRSLTTNVPGEVVLELVEAISIAEFHGLATFAASNSPAAAVGDLVVVWVDNTHFRISALGAISEDAPCTVMFAVRRIPTAQIVGTNAIPPA
jgi:hypothetical protein